ncbi:TELO2-interacting protein 1 homolog isoform X2 [Prorops nasuta]|uniref:TELO2-interacting protein 1 homolog isoform X2 n=2 Tax=Prorops nasuta TaxID=863751 RepID=UPI0034CFE0EB
MDNIGVQEAFMNLKPLCDALIHEPTIKNISKIEECINEFPDAIVQDLLKYILFPITVHLRNDSINTRTKEQLVRLMDLVLSKTRITNIKHFTELYSYLLILIYDRNQPNMVILSREELKLVVLSSLKTLMHHCNSEVTEELYTQKYIPKLAQSIYSCVAIARTERSVLLRVKAIETLMALCQVDDMADPADIVFRDQVANVIMRILPGITGGLLEIATGNDTQNHKITMIAVKALSEIICLVMQDTQTEDDCLTIDNLIKKSKTPQESLSIIKQNENTVEINSILSTNIRNKEWFNAAAIKLNLVIKGLNEIVRHSHYRVRLILAKSINLLLNKCPRNMKSNLLELTEFILTLSEDENKDVREEAQKVLKNISKDHKENLCYKQLIEQLEDNFYKYLTELPRNAKVADAAEQLSLFNRVCGYLRLFGKQRLPIILASAPHTKRLILALIFVLEIECSNITLLEEIGIKEVDNIICTNESNSWISFKFIENSKCKEKISEACKLLGEMGDIRIMIDNLLMLITEAPQYRKEVILLLNWIIEIPSDESTLDESFYTEIVNTYIDIEMWYLPFKVSNELSLRDAQSNVVQCCLLTEGLGCIAKALRQGFDLFLLETLYLIIERAGSGLSLISFVGVQTLGYVAKSQNHESIESFLRENMDYITYHITMKLKCLERNPGVLDVVQAVMKYSTFSILPCLKHVIDDIFIQLGKRFVESNIYPFLKLFYAFVTSVKKIIDFENEIVVESECKIVKEDPAECVIKSVLEYYEAKLISKNYMKDFDEEETKDLPKDSEFDEYEDKENKGNENYEEDEKPDRPIHIKMIEEILKRCLHYIPFKNEEISLLAMLTVQEGLPLLMKWEDQLLPIVHVLWHPLIERFHDKNPLIINRAWQLLNVLGDVSKDFIRVRTLKQILPALSKFLTESAKHSFKKDSGHVYIFTQVYKLQRELLSTFGRTAINLKLRERELWDLLSLAEPYLSSLQNPTLQKCSIELYKEIADYYGDIAWVKCLAIWSSKIASQPIPIDATLDTAKLEPPNAVTKNEYYKNVARIIMYIERKECDL